MEGGVVLLIVGIAWLGLSMAIAGQWEGKGHSAGAGFACSFFLSPVIGFIIGALLERPAALKEAAALEDGTNRKCPFCAELIKAEAKVCRYCSRDLPAPTTSAPLSVEQARAAVPWTYGKKAED